MADTTTTTSKRLDDSAVQTAIDNARSQALALQRLGDTLIQTATYPLHDDERNNMKRVASIPGDLSASICYATEHAVEIVEQIEKAFTHYLFAQHKRDKEAEPPLDDFRLANLYAAARDIQDVAGWLSAKRKAEAEIAGTRDAIRTNCSPSPAVVELIDAHREAWAAWDDDRYLESCDRTGAALKAVLAFRPTGLADVRAVAKHLLEIEHGEEGVPHTERVIQCGLLDPWCRALAGMPPEADAAELEAANV